MAQSSIHIGVVTTGSFLHNDRTVKPSYLIDSSENNVCTTSAKDALKKLHLLKLEAEKNYTARTGQKIQKKAVFLKEAIVNLEAHHTINDLEPIIEKLKSYGFTILQTSIHHDEGFVSGKRTGKNYHAHITLFNLDPKSGKTIKFGKNYRHELSKLQTFTAKTLKMERGSVSVLEEAHAINRPLEKAKRRLDTHEYKRAMKLKDDLETQNLRMRTLLGVAAVALDKSITPGKIEQIEAMKELAGEEYIRIEKKWENVDNVYYNFRETQKMITGLKALNIEQKKALHQLNSEINKIKKDDEQKLTKIKELEKHILEITKNALETQKTFEEHKNVLIASNQQQIKELELMDKLYGQIEGAIEENATNKELRELLKSHEPYKPRRSTYLKAKERAKNAYRARIRKATIQDKVKDQDIRDIFNKTQEEEIRTQVHRLFTLS